ncbi:tRNA (guanosine(37)-N1)-methyltransferase TrmD [bacterium]|nr:MAG: tRNA (guanosine(37)-N1)-methyltransferase TrmD [bacterium]
MRLDLISAVPKLLESPIEYSIIKRARNAGLVEVHIHDLRDFTKDKHRKIDDYPYGGGAGMVLSPQPIFDCIEHLLRQRKYDHIIYTAPDGKAFNQTEANRLSLSENIIVLCGHYKGVDQRVRDQLITDEYSIGDFVLSGGELPALVMIDSLIRLIPGVLGDAESALEDSFQNGLLGAPVYTRPAEFRGLNVPEELLGGNHKLVEEWKSKQSLDRTKNLRPDLIQKNSDN